MAARGRGSAAAAAAPCAHWGACDCQMGESMALSDGEDAEVGWTSDSDGEADAEADALFGSLHGDDEERDVALDALTARWLSMEPVEADALALVERASWDEEDEPRDDEQEEQEERVMPTPLHTQVGRAGQDHGPSHEARSAGGLLQWGLVSPCSEEAGSPSSVAQDSFFGGEDAFDADADAHSDNGGNVSVCSTFAARVSDDESDLEAPVPARHRSQPEDEPARAHDAAAKRQEQQFADEQEAFLARVSSSSSASAVSFHAQPMNPFALTRAPPPPSYARPADSDSDSDSDSDCDCDCESDRTSVEESPHGLGVARVPSFARWRRQKARTCSSVGSAGLPLALDALKARARTLSQQQQLRLRPRPRQRRGDSIDDYEHVEHDDGDFSSDDEGYAPTTHRRRASELEPCAVQRRRSSRAASAASRLSLGPSLMGKRLQDARQKLSTGLHLLRSGSTSTVASEESYLDSPAAEDIKSVLPGLHLETSAAWATQASHTYTYTHTHTHTHTYTSSNHGEHDADAGPPRSRQQQLRAGVVKAAGFLNAASVEAARKLKTRAGGLRGQQVRMHTQGKATTSETEEDEPEAAASTVSPVATPGAVTVAVAVTPAS